MSTPQTNASRRDNLTLAFVILGALAELAQLIL